MTLANLDLLAQELNCEAEKVLSVARHLWGKQASIKNVRQAHERVEKVSDLCSMINYYESISNLV